MQYVEGEGQNELPVEEQRRMWLVDGCKVGLGWGKKVGKSLIF